MCGACRVNSSLLPVCITLYTLASGGSARAQDHDREEGEAEPPIAWSHREDVGVLARGSSASNGLELGVAANGHFEFWAGWRETPYSGVSAFLSHEEDDGRCLNDAGLGGRRCPGVHPSPLGTFETRVLGGSLLDDRRGFITDTDVSAILAVGAEDGAWLASWGARQDLALALGPFTFDATVERQVPVGFNDFWWRSNRGRTLVGGGFRAPTWLAINWPSNQIGLFDSGFHVYGTTVGSDYASTEVHMDATIGTYEGFGSTERIVSRMLGFDAYAVMTPSSRPGPSPANVRMTFFQIASSHLNGFSFDADVSLAMLMMGNSGSAQDVILPAGGLRLSWARGDEFYVPSESLLNQHMPKTRGEGVAIALNSFERLDPSSLAVDNGGRLVLEGDWKLAENVVLGADMNWIVARRGWISDEAPALPFRVGDVFTMFRANLSAEWLLGHGAALSANAYVERSDRDDTLMYLNPSLDVRNAYGATLSFTLSGDSSTAVQ